MSSRKAKRNIYKHSIDLKKLKVFNAPRDEFREKLEKIPYRGYEVEQLSDGRKIVIAKPGGKFVFGRPKKEDFLVYVYDPREQTLWQITHKQIFEDLELKAEENPQIALLTIECLEQVHRGEEPDEVLKKGFNEEIPGEPIEVLLKAYKWIWGQEDVNYPTGEGRDMSMKGILELKGRIQSSFQENN